MQKKENKSMKVKKIDSIENMAVFKNFQWKSEFKKKEGFKKINIFYSWNYSGKTTLSRIFRALEPDSPPDKYKEPKLSSDDEIQVTQELLKKHNHVVQVFNKDFVKENLGFIYDEDKSIKSFTILGKESKENDAKIKSYKGELGTEEDKSGLWGEYLDAEEKFEGFKTCSILREFAVCIRTSSCGPARETRPPKRSKKSR